MEGDGDGSRDRLHLAVACFGFSTFVLLFVLVVAGGPLAHFDTAVRDWSQAHPSGWLLDVCRYFTDVFSPPTEGVALGVVAGTLALRRRSWRPIVVGGVTAWLLMALVLTLKHAVGRPGPGELTEGALSFPSGHTAAALVCLGMIVLLTTDRRPDLRRPLLTAVAVVTLLVAVALVYHSYHWFSDVVASVPLGIAMLALVAPFVSPRKE